MQTLLEADQYLLDWRFILAVLRFLLNDLFHDLLRFFDVVCLAQICDDTIIRVEIDLCLSFDATFGILVLFELIIRNFGERFLDLDVLSDGPVDPLNGILYVNGIPYDHIRVLEGLDLIRDLNPLILHIELSSTTPALVLRTSATSSSSLSTAAISVPRISTLIQLDLNFLHEFHIVLIFELLLEVFFYSSIVDA